MIAGRLGGYKAGKLEGLKVLMLASFQAL